MTDYCGADARRLKSMVLAPATDPAWSAQAIKEMAQEDWVAAVWPLLPEGCRWTIPSWNPSGPPPTRPICPLCTTALRSRRRTFGYRDVWDNPAMGRCAGDLGRPALPLLHAHGRYAGSLSSAAGWHPGVRPWLAAALAAALDQTDRLCTRLGLPNLKHTPLEYTQMGRVFCGIDFSEEWK